MLYPSINEIRKKANAVIQPERFTNAEIIEKDTSEVLGYDDTTYIDLYKLTSESVFEEFIANNPEGIKHPLNTWFFYLLITIKKQVPKLDKKNYIRVSGVWDIYKDICYKCGGYPFYEGFIELTSIYKSDLDKYAELSPEYMALAKKIREECEAAMVAQVASNPYTQVNKMFLLKTMYGYKEDSVKEVKVTHELRNYENVSKYRLGKKD